MYYLQSRYYTPVLGRFLNADAYASTGQSILGNNMFAYCENNPVTYSDPGGTKKTIWFHLFEDHDPGYIHRAVQVHILSTNNIEAVLYKSEYIMPGIGRADIVCPSTGEMWEIKHGGSSNDAWDAGISNANARLDKYLLNGCSFKKGRAKAFSGAFVISLDATKYLISYSTPEQGVILYTVMQLNDPQRKEDFAYAPHTLYQEQKELMGIIAFAFVGSAISPFPQQEILMDA